MSNSNLWNIAAVGAAAFGLYAAYKCKKMADKLEVSIDKMADSTPVDISNKAVQIAVERAATNAVNKRVDDIAESAVNDIRADIEAQVRQTVKEAYGDVKDDVKDRLEQKVGEVNIEKIRTEVVDKARKRAAEKFDSDLDGVLSKYNDELRNVAKIYSQIASSMPYANNPNFRMI